MEFIILQCIGRSHFFSLHLIFIRLPVLFSRFFRYNKDSMELVRSIFIRDKLDSMRVTRFEDRIYVVGRLTAGTSATNMFLAYYDMELDEFTPCSTANGFLDNFEIAEMNGEIYVFGLNVGDDNIHKYNLYAKQWIVVNMPKNNN